MTTKEVIRKSICEDEKLLLLPDEVEKLTDKIYRHARKVFATVLWCALGMNHLKALLDDGITDTDMPIERGCSQRLKGKIANTFFKSFEPNQKYVHVAYLKMDGTQELNAEMSIPINYLFRLVKGSFGDVWKVFIHPDYCGFTSVCHCT